MELYFVWKMFLQGRRSWGGGGGARALPKFGILVNPIRTKGGRLCPPYYYWAPPSFWTMRRLWTDLYHSWRSASSVSLISPISALWVLVLIPDLVFKLGLAQNQTWKVLTVLTVNTESFSTQWLVYCLAAAESGLHSHLRLSFFITDCLLWDIKWLLPCAVPFLLA